MNGFPLFRVGRIPVLISFWYVIVMAYIGFISGMTTGLLWATAVTISILVHEFGHAFAAQHYDLRPSILLHGWGGLTFHRAPKRDRHSVFILIAGPGAGLVLGIISVIALSTRGGFSIEPGVAPVLLDQFLWYMVYINIFWSGVNLLPLWPLDGGQLFEIALKQKLSAPKAHAITHGAGVALGAAAAFVGLVVFQSFFIGILAGFLAWSNFTRLKAGPRQARTKVRKTPNAHAVELYDRAVDAMNKWEWEEAVRLGHQMRTENLNDTQIHQVWELLSVATTNMGAYEEALRYIKRAPETEPVRAAHLRCLEELERWEELEALRQQGSPTA